VGDSDLVVLMAKEAIIRIFEDGRLGQINDNHGVTDPGSNGEAVLLAAKLTGDQGLKTGADGMLDYFLSPTFEAAGTATEGQDFFILIERPDATS